MAKICSIDNTTLPKMVSFTKKTSKFENGITNRKVYPKTFKQLMRSKLNVIENSSNSIPNG